MAWLIYIGSWLDYILGGIVIAVALAITLRGFWGVAHWDDERLKKYLNDVAKTPD